MENNLRDFEKFDLLRFGSIAKSLPNVVRSVLPQTQPSFDTVQNIFVIIYIMYIYIICLTSNLLLKISNLINESLIVPVHAYAVLIIYTYICKSMQSIFHMKVLIFQHFNSFHFIYKIYINYASQICLKEINNVTITVNVLNHDKISTKIVYLLSCM